MTDSIKLSPSALHEGDTERMEDKEMKQIRKNNAGANIEGEWFIPLDKQKNALNEAYSLGQSHMKQKAINIFSEEYIQKIARRYEGCELGYGATQSIRDVLSALSEL